SYITLIENIQREELSVIEKGKAYVHIISIHSITQEAIAQRLGKSQSTVANRIRLLSLTEEIQEGLMEKKLTEPHARALMKLKDETLQIEYYNKTIDEQWTVRELEDKVNAWLGKKQAPKKQRKKPKFVSKDVRIATNTIKRSLKMIADTGIKVESEEEDQDDYYQITIRVKKNEK